MAKYARDRRGRPRYRRWATATLLLSALVWLTAGCGSGDDEQAQPPPDYNRVQRSLPPPEMASDSTRAVAADSAAAAGYDAPIAEVPQTDAVTKPEKVSAAAAQTAPPPAKAKPAVVKTAAGDLGPYCLQVGAFRNATYAEQRLTHLTERGVNAVIETATIDGKLYHRVCVPNLPDHSAARRLGDTLKAEYDFPYLIRKE